MAQVPFTQLLDRVIALPRQDNHITVGAACYRYSLSSDRHYSVLNHACDAPGNERLLPQQAGLFVKGELQIMGVGTHLS